MGVYRRKGSDKWWIDYYCNDERIREPISTSKKEAEKVLIQRLNAVNENKHPILRKIKNKKIKFIDFSEKYIREYSKPQKRSYKSDISRLKNLLSYFAGLYIHEIQSYHIVEYRKRRLQQKSKQRKKAISPASINREVVLLKSMLKKAAEWYELELKPIKIYLTKEEPKERILSHEEIRLLIDNSEPPLRHIILVALNTGMRKGEIYKLEWSNVSLNQGFITIAAPTAKSKKIRRIPFNKSLRELFIKLDLARNGKQYVFENLETGKPYFDLKKGWYSLVKRTGIKDLRFHDLRHTFASNYLMRGGDINTLKEILGHEDISTTARYLTIPSAHKRKSMEIFEVPESESNVIDISEVISKK